MNEAQCVQQGGLVGGINKYIDHNPTVGENLDRQIADTEARLAQLKASKETLGPLLNMKIGDLRQAMSY